MADGYDRFDNEGSGNGSSFVMGLLTGTVLGAGLGMLFAPKSGSELRGQIAEQAGSLANTASDGYRRATETASDWADRGRQVYDKARDAVSKGADEAQRYVRDAASNITGASATATPAASTSAAPGYGSSHGSDTSRGESGERSGTRRS
ncbi:MAG TPA: YtxH domain-containing protein [Vicinamibacterales bacterium]|nr:YtxH domain-containing protein [Vicinamibacterales bacterium]